MQFFTQEKEQILVQGTGDILGCYGDPSPSRGYQEAEYSCAGQLAGRAPLLIQRHCQDTAGKRADQQVDGRPEASKSSRQASTVDQQAS